MAAVGLSGNLVDFGIADVFQLIGQQRKTGVLELKNGSMRIELVFDRGLVVSAAPAVGRAGDLDPVADRLVRCGKLTRERAGEAMAAGRSAARPLASTLVEHGWAEESSVREARDLVTRDAIFDVLRWQKGTFDFRTESVSHDRDLGELLGAEQILMDGLRMVDEWQSLVALVPSEDAVFARAGGIEVWSGQPAREGVDARKVERVFALVDGRLTARRVIDLARLGTFDGTRCLAELCRSGAIRPMTPEGARTVRRYYARMAGGRGLAALRGHGASLASIAALAAVTWCIAVASASPAPIAEQPIERSTLAALREDHAARAVRHAIEAHRLRWGAWPDRIEELESAGLLPSGALATLGGRFYYSKHRDQGPFFLAPER